MTCFCTQQLVNVLRQLITLYPTTTLNVGLESGGSVSGRPGSLLPPPNTNPNAGLFQLVNSQGVPEETVSICRITSVGLNGATYNNAITYLPAPAEPPAGCEANCEAAIRAFLPVGTQASISAGGTTVANGTVLRDEFGMIVVVGPNNSNPVFVSSCKIETIS